MKIILLALFLTACTNTKPVEVPVAVKPTTPVAPIPSVAPTPATPPVSVAPSDATPPATQAPTFYSP